MGPKTHSLSDEPNDTSPGAKIRYITKSERGDLTHAVCRPGTVLSTHYLDMDEAYFILAGHGEITRRTEDREGVTVLRPGRWVQMPAHTKFQYRAGVERAARAAAWSCASSSLNVTRSDAGSSPKVDSSAAKTTATTNQPFP